VITGGGAIPAGTDPRFGSFENKEDTQRICREKSIFL
jgi:hypothetical protein